MIDLYLTRRNLQTLLNKLDRNRRSGGRPSACTLIKLDTQHPKYALTEPVKITALEDDEYYVDRQPGVVLPEDEPEAYDL